MITNRGSNNYNTGSVTVDTSEDLILSTRETRARGILRNAGNIDCKIGKTGVRNFTLVKGASISFEHNQAIYGATASSSTTIEYWEEYD